MSVIHKFYDKLAYSLNDDDEEIWYNVYHSFFTTFRSFQRVESIKQQRKGRDRIIILDDNSKVFIDEKKRPKHYRTNGKTDIILEYLSVDTTGAPGWIEKNLSIDYVAYMIVPIRRVAFLPWKELKCAWDINKSEWLSTYHIPPAPNVGYKTWSVAVPSD